MAGPSGTVTFLFTDIEGSTRLWETAPAEMRMALARHDEIVREAVQSGGGHVFSTGGDGFAVAFGRAGDAVLAAVKARRDLTAEPWAESTPIRVRIGVHTGEAVERNGDYFGPAVNRAARVMAAAPGGQIVVSGVTAGLISDRVDVTLVDLGSHRLRGVTEPVRLFGVEVDGQGGFEGRLATARGVPGNLPRPLTEMVGRATELQHLVAELGVRRLITLTGPGGVGKTRTAVEAGWLATSEFTDGVWFVDLGPVTDPAAVTFTAAMTMSAQPRSGLSVEDTIIDALSGRRALVVIDNCEHLLSAAAALVRRIVTECPAVTVLATSREPLGLPGERVHTVASLDPTLEGAELFRDRAFAADDTFVCGDGDATVIAEICTRLDGIPLAIELAAARARFMTLTDLLDRLRNRFKELRGGSGGGVERHQTLRATVAWSYQLLTERERVVFDRVSVFAGGFDVPAATAVCAASDLDEDDIADVLASLVDKSMLLIDRSGRNVRYRLLETLRQYGEERLGDRWLAGAIRDRHLDHYQSIAEQASAAYAGPDQIDAIRRVDRDWDNIRAAFEWSRTGEDDDRTVAFALACAKFAQPLLRFEHRQWIDGLIATKPGDPALRCSLYASAANWANLAAEHDATVRLAQLGIEAARGADPSALMQCWLALAVAMVSSGRASDALDALRSAEALVGADPYNEGVWLMCARFVSHAVDPESMPGYHDRFGALSTAVGAPLWIAMHLSVTGLDLVWSGKPHEARRLIQEGLRLCEETRTTARGVALIGLALAATAIDDDEARLELRDALVELHGLNDWNGVWIAAENLAIHWIRVGALEPGAVVLGHLEANGRSQALLLPARAAAIDVLRADTEAARAQARGASMTREQVVAHILDCLDDPARRSEADPAAAEQQNSPLKAGPVT